eukprot:830017-Rhodomonas_salina.2
MAPKPEDVWNARLVRALKARYFYEQSKSGRSFQWQKGYEIIQAVKKDIHMFKTGKVANLPKDLGSQTVMQVVVAIIKGEKPIIPPEMEAFDPDIPGFVMPAAEDDLSQHSYLRNMSALFSFPVDARSCSKLTRLSPGSIPRRRVCPANGL